MGDKRRECKKSYKTNFVEKWPSARVFARKNLIYFRLNKARFCERTCNHKRDKTDTKPGEAKQQVRPAEGDNKSRLLVAFPKQTPNWGPNTRARVHTLSKLVLGAGEARTVRQRDFYRRVWFIRVSRRPPGPNSMQRAEVNALYLLDNYWPCQARKIYNFICPATMRGVHSENFVMIFQRNI